jgi:hypothetical protein
MQGSAQQLLNLPDDQPAHIGGFVFPPEFEGATRLSVRGYANPALGSSVGYQKGKTTTTIYVYDSGVKAIPDDPDHIVIMTEFRAAMDEALRFRQGARVQDGFFVFDDSKQKRLNCAWLHYDGSVGGAVCLGGAKNNFIKFRTSAPDGAGSQSESADFIRSWLPAFWPAS